MFKTIEVEINDRIAILTLNRPDKLNAINNELVEEMTNVLKHLSTDTKVRVIMITGKGKAFCPGADLSEATNVNTAVSSYNWLRKVQQLMIDIEENPKAVIACINGLAMGGGVELALACDIRIASSSAVFALPEINVGLLPGSGGMSRLCNLIGPARTKELVLTGRKVSAEEALLIGLVTEIVEREKLMDRALQYAQDLASKPPLGVRLAKDTINSNIGANHRTGLDNEAKANWILFSTKDRLEGMRAFLERRQPVFCGE